MDFPQSISPKKPLGDDITCSPKVQLSRNTTASDLLVAFSPRSQAKKDFKPWTSPLEYPIAMTDRKRDLRRKTPVTYLVSDDSEGEQSPSEVSSAFSTPRKPRRSHAILDLEEDFEPEPAKTPPPRLSAAGHSLRQHQHLHLSLRAQENGDKQIIKRRRRRKINAREKDGVPNAKHESAQRTSRAEIRDAIATELL